MMAVGWVLCFGEGADDTYSFFTYSSQLEAIEHPRFVIVGFCEIKPIMEYFTRFWG